MHGDFGLVRVHEFVDPMDVLSPLPANQAVAFARMSRSCCTWRNCRRSRTNSSRSALLSTSRPDEGLPSSAAACATHFPMLVALQSNSRASCVAERPARTSSTICRRNSAGYGGFGVGISDSFFRKDEVSVKTGQLHIGGSHHCALFEVGVDLQRRCGLVSGVRHGRTGGR